jgi:hypothetical protein
MNFKVAGLGVASVWMNMIVSGASPVQGRRGQVNVGSF